MGRAIWNGVLTFGLVTVPVGLFSATESHTLRYHQLQRGTSDRIHNLRVNERTGEVVPYEEIVRGYDVDGDHVVVDPGELDEAVPGELPVIDVTGFVDFDQIDPVHFDSTYYLAPKGEEYVKVYEVLRATLHRTGRAGIATVAMRGKQYLTALRARTDVLVLHTLHWADEVRDPGHDLEILPRHPEITGRAPDMAQQMIDELGTDWRPGDYHDTYEERVRGLIEAKRRDRRAQGGTEPPEAAPVTGDGAEAPRELPSAPEHKARKKAGKKGKKEGREAGTADLEGLTRSELYRRAAGLGVRGRSKMDREQLVRAVAGARGDGPETAP